MNKRVVFWAVVSGVVVGQSLVIWLAPRYLVWYFAPPAPTAFDCSVPVSWALSRMQSAIMYGTGVGALIGLICAVVFRDRFKARVPDR